MIKLNHLIVLVVVGVSILGIVSCKDSSNPVTPDKTIPSELVPLKIGNSWSFRVTTYDTLGAISWIDTLTYYVKKDTLINGVLWYLQGFDGHQIGQLAFRNDSLGHHITNFESYSIFYPFPADVGESGGGVFSVTANDTIINTDIGELMCYVYKGMFYGFSYNTIYAPGIGLVYRETPMKPFNRATVYLVQTRELVATSVELN